MARHSSSDLALLTSDIIRMVVDSSVLRDDKYIGTMTERAVQLSDDTTVSGCPKSAGGPSLAARLRPNPSTYPPIGHLDGYVCLR